jgi:hypothetical protein
MNDARRLANHDAVDRMVRGHPFLIDVRPAVDVIPGMRRTVILHAGPPLPWSSMVPPMQAAIQGALVFDGQCRTLEDAAELARSGEITFGSAHDHGAVGPMAGIICSGMPVFVVRNETFGNTAFASINEGLGRVLRFGANDDAVLSKLRWMRDVFAPALHDAIAHAGPIDLRQVIAEALHRGDECHNRNKAATAQMLKILAPHLVRSSARGEAAAQCLEFIGGNDHFFLNLSIAHSKSIADPAHGIAGSSVITAMAANGVSFGLRVSGLGAEWVTAPVGVPEGHWFEGYTADDAVPLMGDSYASEVIGIGAFALAAAPAIASFIGGSASQMVEHTIRMYSITLQEHPIFRIPALDFRGTPVGIDVDRVVETGTPPILNTGVACRRPGVGQIGASIASAPLACFHDAQVRLREPATVKGTHT